jgi:DNA-binding response OmpR family regulator
MIHLNSLSNTTPLTICIVEDNVRLQEELSLALRNNGLNVFCSDNGEDMNVILLDHHVDIVILDLNLPGDEDGIQICQRLRKTHSEIGIVMLTGRIMGSDRSVGYLVGADVYLTKPTRANELLSVIRNLGARLNKHEITYGWELNLRSLKLVSPSGSFVLLTATEANILSDLAMTTTFTSYEKLISRFFEADVTGKTAKARLEVAISRLRTKLKSIGEELLIKLIWGKGYQLSMPIKIIN